MPKYSKNSCYQVSEILNIDKVAIYTFLAWLLTYQAHWGMGYIHTSGIYRCATLVGRFAKKVCTYGGCFLASYTGPKPLIFCGECDNSLALGALILGEI